MSVRTEDAVQATDVSATTTGRDSAKVPDTSTGIEVEPVYATRGEATAGDNGKDRHRFSLTDAIAYGLLPCLAVVLAAGAGFFKWQSSSARASDTAVVESVQAAKDSTVALLSYKPDTAEKDLAAAQERLTGDFRASYDQLTHDVVIPGAKQKQISAVATVPAAASVSANENHSVVMVFVDQTVIVGNSAPSDTASTVKVSLDKVDGRWLISGFDPI